MSSHDDEQYTLRWAVDDGRTQEEAISLHEFYDDDTLSSIEKILNCKMKRAFIEVIHPYSPNLEDLAREIYKKLQERRQAASEK